MIFNSRLDTIQAVVGNWLIPQTKKIASQRIKNARYLDKELSKIKEIKIPPRPKNYKVVFHLYIVFAKQRDALLNYCIKKGIEAKIHYPVPMYRQEAMKYLKHKVQSYEVGYLLDKDKTNIRAEIKDNIIKSMIAYAGSKGLVIFTDRKATAFMKSSTYLKVGG